MTQTKADSKKGKVVAPKEKLNRRNLKTVFRGRVWESVTKVSRGFTAITANIEASCQSFPGQSQDADSFYLADICSSLQMPILNTYSRHTPQF